MASPSSASQTFSERIARRLDLWWGKPRRWGAWRTYIDALHRLRERQTFRDRSDPDEAWRCCEFWQRTLLGKWNSREFAARHGCLLPDLYWRGRAPSKRLLESLPGHFVIRPVWGYAGHGVHVLAEGRELLRGESASPAELRARLLRPRALAWSVPMLIEEFVRTEDGQYRLPVEYGCHTFGDTVAAVQVVARTSIYPGGAKQRYYTPGWEPFADPMDVRYPQGEGNGPPRCLDEMLRLAVMLGTALGTYARIDFFATDRGCVFNEFSSTPRRGIGYTPYCDDLFARLWEQKFSHAT